MVLVSAGCCLLLGFQSVDVLLGSVGGVIFAKTLYSSCAVMSVLGSCAKTVMFCGFVLGPTL